MKCIGTKTDGTPCKANARGGSDYCGFHAKQEYPEIPTRLQPEPVVEQVETVGRGIRWVPYGFFDGGVSEIAAIRAPAVAYPNCPVDGTDMLKQKDGSYLPNPNFTGEMNCQQAYRLPNKGAIQGRWDVRKCIELGHDPYYTRFRRPVLREIMDESGFVVDTKTQYQVEKRINIQRVSINPRHSSGQDMIMALERGAIPLKDFDCSCSKHEFVHRHRPPCEFRACVEVQRVKTTVGYYCGERHARLVLADLRRKILASPESADPYVGDETLQEREEQLGSLMGLEAEMIQT